MTRQAPPPPRPRTPSGHDVPIPEAVFVALAGLQGAVTANAQQTAAWQANHDGEHSKIMLALKDVKASNGHETIKVIAGVVIAALGVIGGQRALAPTPPPATTVVSESALSTELGACETLPESNQPQCVLAAYERDMARKVARGRR
jgi:hypothetical protein